jgi:peroxiredoxin
MRCAVLLFALAAPLGAATADDLLTAAVATVPADEAGPGSPARAQAIAAVVDTPGLEPADKLVLEAALAEAWLDAYAAPKAEAAAQTVLAAVDADAALRERAGLVLVAAWQLRAQAAEPVLPDLLAAVAALPPRVRARALSARAQVKLAAKDASALADLDAALALLASAEAGERVPLYALRLTAMEDTGAKPEAIRAWLDAHRTDPAATLAAESALSAGQRLAGQPAPPLHLKRLDGQLGEVDLAALRGRPVLIVVIATWSKPAAAFAQAAEAARARWQRSRDAGLAVIGVSLDTKDTLAGLLAWIAAQGLAYPLAGEGLGWDSEVAATWHWESLPQLILVDAQGQVVANALGGATAAELAANLDAAIAPLFGGGKPAVGAPVPTARPAGDDGIP